jgi:hypothetical protein
MKNIKKAAEILYADVGFFPDDGALGADVGFNDPALVPAAQLTSWRGPYLDRFPADTPFGGQYEFEYQNRTAFNFDGVAGNEVFISVYGGMDTVTMQRIDEIIDDGVLTTGMAQQINSQRLALYIGEGPDW